ncbi:putative ankyrin repeats containing protein [Candidatus Cyrtobacter comes]|uniref:Ankyrin repeats containing protein n=1 Tax=Candidatus Cyrtobacter comes TaxID=675776 RepID=A0ABU5L9C3_9RICK|nr:ankyrin repeat domain-containing protein [Candidatus Cyrtobacter comes]MDZ5762724.1 putative ankyrin repeats containing protein [Candidatus Cyrtobacter comes]
MPKFLCDNGADPNVSDMSNGPLDIAVHYGYSPLIGSLVKAGANPYTKTVPGKLSPIERAAFNNMVVAVKAMLRSSHKSEGFPLHFTAESMKSLRQRFFNFLSRMVLIIRPV